MKKLCLLVFSVIFLLSNSGFAVEQASQNFTTTQKYFCVYKASEDIFTNLSFLASIKKDHGESIMLAWAMPIGDKMPSQPVAIIKLIAMTDYPVEDICPRMFIEDMVSIDTTVRWMELSIQALDSFIMKDAKEERIRQECMAEIQGFLESKDSWQIYENE